MVNIIIDVDRRILVFLADKFKKVYPVAVGKKTTPSPLGDWTIVEKAVDPGGPFGVRWMRLSVPWGGYGIHGTNNPKSIGKAVSNGCIRMYNEDVVEIYDRTPIGSRVYIIGKAYNGRPLKKGDIGTDVMEVQSMLKKLGYYRAKIDNIYGDLMEKAVVNFQKDKGLPADGIVGVFTLDILRREYGKLK